MRLIKIKEVMNKTDLSRSSIYKFIAQGEFPKPVQLGVKRVAWVESEIHEWIQLRIAHRDS